MKRTLTGIAIVIILVSSIVIHPYLFMAMLCLISIGGIYEFFTIVSAENTKPQRATVALLSTSILVTLSLNLSGVIPFKYLLVNVVLVLLIFLRELFGTNEKPFANLAFTMIGLVYITLPLCCLTWIGYYSSNSFSWHLILAFFALVWIYDTFAYFTGMLIGRHKLFERISPKKSWEGAIGGAVFSMSAP